LGGGPRRIFRKLEENKELVTDEGRDRTELVRVYKGTQNETEQIYPQEQSRLQPCGGETAGAMGAHNIGRLKMGDLV